MPESVTLWLKTIPVTIESAAPMALDKLTQGLELFGPGFMQLYGQSEGRISSPGCAMRTMT